MARTQFTFTFTNAQPGAAVSFLSTPVFADASTTVPDGPTLVLSAGNTVSVWADAGALTAHTVDGNGAPLSATATASAPSVTSADGTPGQNPFGAAVESVVAGSGISVDATDPANPIVAATGGGGSGGVVLAHVPFDYATPDLDTGAALYVPTIGDVVLNAWIEVDIAFDGTSFGDIGTFVDDIAGMYGQATGQGQDMTVADDESAGTGWLYNNNWPSLMGIGDSTTRRRCVPAKFTAANPVKVVVSQDGTTTGGASGATQGSAVLWLLIATPA